jgi:hypothetical protein
MCCFSCFTHVSSLTKLDVLAKIIVVMSGACSLELVTVIVAKTLKTFEQATLVKSEETHSLLNLIFIQMCLP